MGRLLSAIVVGTALTVPDVGFTQPAQSPRQPQISPIGYPTVAAALDGLRKKSGVTVRNEGGWTVIEERTSLTIWSFTPPGHPAHPAVIQRTIRRESNGDLVVDMNGLCESTKPACDALNAEFEELNRRMREDLARRRKS